jgi:hypothetical protein
MSEIIDEAIDVFEKQIQALYTNDFEKFMSFMTPRIRKQLTFETFQKAIDLYKHTPIGREAIDIQKTLVYREGEITEIPEQHVKLILVGTERTLCHVVKLKGEWLIDDIYWRIEDLESQESFEEEDSHEDDSSEEELTPISEEEKLVEESTEKENNEENMEESEDEPSTDENIEEEEALDE